VRSAGASRVALVDDAPRDASVWTATGSEPPVFFDHHGRRRPWVFGGGATVVALAAMWLCGLAAGTFGFAKLPGPAAGLSVLSHLSSVYAPDVTRHRRDVYLSDALHRRHSVFAIDLPRHHHAGVRREFAVDPVVRLDRVL